MQVEHRKPEMEPLTGSNGNPAGSQQPGPARQSQDHGVPHDLPKVSGRAMLLIAIVTLVIFSAIFAIGWFPHSNRMEQAKSEAAESATAKPRVEAVPVRRSNESTELLLPGDAEPQQSTALYARTSGYLKELKADIGDKVKAAQLLAVIDTPEVDAEVEQAEATLEQAKVTVSRATNEFNFNQSTYDRFQGLSATGGVTQQQMDEKRSAFNIASSSLSAAKANVKAAQASLKKFTDMKAFQNIYAPFDGTVATRNYDLGALISPTTTGMSKELFRIDQTATLRIFVNVPQSYVSAIQVGQSAEFLVRNFAGKPFPGTVARSAGSLDASTRTLRVELSFPNAEGRLLSHMYGQVRFQLRQESLPLVVPTSALVFGAEGMKVAVVDGSTIRFQKVTVGRNFGTQVEVTEGLKENEQVVANPGERITDGADVEVMRRPQTAPAKPGVPTASTGK